MFDPSVLPSTGTPEPGGLSYYQVLHSLKKVFAARLAYQLMTYKFMGKE